MRYSAIRSMDISNGEGIGASLFVQGCHIHCRGCFNKNTWDFNGGKEFDDKALQTVLDIIKPEYITRFSVLGGEPLEEINLFTLATLLQRIKKEKPNIKIWLYTGYTMEQIRDRIKEEKNSHYLKAILDNVNVIVAGPFIQEEKDLSLPWCGSRNQQVIRWEA